MSNESKETIADIAAEMRGWVTYSQLSDLAYDEIVSFADRIEAAAKREADSIHRAMVLIAGIEMEDSNNPPRLWTALEDAYNALSDALGADGEITADLEEAKVIGRHFVIKPYGNAAAIRETLLRCDAIAQLPEIREYIIVKEMRNLIKIALSAPPRNCDRFATAKEAGEAFISEACENPCGNCTVSDECYNPLVHECGIDWLFAEAKGETK